MSIPGPQDITRKELDNGITILVRENHASPSVVAKGYLEVGAYDESTEQIGLADFTADGLMRGTTTYDFQQIYEALESVGANVAIGSGTHHTNFGTKSLVEDLPLALDVLASALRHPTFPAAQVERLRGEILTDLEEREHDTRRMAALTFYELAYPPSHPYATPTNGYPETVSAIAREDLVSFHQHGYGAEGMVIVVVGAVETDAALGLVAEIFGDWEGSIYAREPLPDVPQIESVRREEVVLPGKTQSDIMLGYPGPPRAEPDFLDAALCNTILGVFGLMGRLGQNVRDSQGLAYYSYSRLDGGLGPGPWRVVAGVNPDNVEQAIESIRDEIRCICEELVPEEELADNKAFVTGTLPLLLETNDGVARIIRDMERYDLGLDYLQRHADLINAITAEDVRAAARRWLDPDAYALAVAGPALE